MTHIDMHFYINADEVWAVAADNHGGIAVERPPVIPVERAALGEPETIRRAIDELYPEVGSVERVLGKLKGAFRRQLTVEEIFAESRRRPSPMREATGATSETAVVRRFPYHLSLLYVPGRHALVNLGIGKGRSWLATKATSHELDEDATLDDLCRAAVAKMREWGVLVD